MNNKNNNAHKGILHEAGKAKTEGFHPETTKAVKGAETSKPEAGVKKADAEKKPEGSKTVK